VDGAGFEIGGAWPWVAGFCGFGGCAVGFCGFDAFVAGFCGFDACVAGFSDFVSGFGFVFVVDDVVFLEEVVVCFFCTTAGAFPPVCGDAVTDVTGGVVVPPAGGAGG